MQNRVVFSEQVEKTCGLPLGLVCVQGMCVTVGRDV